MNLPEIDRCAILNSKTIHGWSELYEVTQYKDIEKAKHKTWLRLVFILMTTSGRYHSIKFYKTFKDSQMLNVTAPMESK